jgi:hypothetical protein
MTDFAPVNTINATQAIQDYEDDSLGMMNAIDRYFPRTEY